MRLSELQRHILRESYQYSKPRISRRLFDKFYQKHQPPHSIAASVTSSLESLIEKRLMIGFGRRTPEKWFIEEVRLTAEGRRTARRILGVQETLPLKNTHG